MTHGHGKSDNFVVPKKPSNKATEPAAETVEGRRLVKGNLNERSTRRTQSRANVSQALMRVREVAKKDRKQRFTALLHHVYAIENLEQSYYAIKRDASAGIDGQTWRDYGNDLKSNLDDLSSRLKRGAYRVSPVRRAYILKSDGRRRPLGVPTLEDKIVQRAVVTVMNAIYEEDFIGFSYGFRPGRNQHDALDALAVGIPVRKVNWVLDADIRSFFDTIKHDWLMKMVEHRIADKRVLRLIQKWLTAGVLEEGRITESELGTVQGGSISPLLANIYLHYVFDLWVQQWRKKQARGEVIVVRFADDFIVGFEHRTEAERFLEELKARFSKFGLELHSEKTRLIEFGRFAARDRGRRGDGKPETFNFLGFTHICDTTRGGKFTVRRQTMRKKWQAKLLEVKTKLRQRLHESIPEQGAYLRAVITGHMRYYGVPLNHDAIKAFRWDVSHIWWRLLKRRSQRNRITLERMLRYVDRWFPPVRICHPFPYERLCVKT